MGRSGLVLLVVGALVLAGCATPVDPNPGAPDESPNQDGGAEEDAVDCRERYLGSNATGGQGEMAWIDCYAETSGRNAMQASCPNPGQAELKIQANITEGRVRVTVSDAAGVELVNASFQQTSETGRNVSMQTQDAQPGAWTLATTRSAPFQGGFEAKLWCPH